MFEVVNHAAERAAGSLERVGRRFNDEDLVDRFLIAVRRSYRSKYYRLSRSMAPWTMPPWRRVEKP
uniref:RNA polymerase sigma-70 region 2 domain-containing protein n=1 Tax=Romanomermis culicivorax TaxID=13658 RepID=A0A915K3F7_ROMCU